jgi:hypothetical protein
MFSMGFDLLKELGLKKTILFFSDYKPPRITSSNFSCKICFLPHKVPEPGTFKMTDPERQWI